jgi:hypothetical protein
MFAVWLDSSNWLAVVAATLPHDLVAKAATGAAMQGFLLQKGNKGSNRTYKAGGVALACAHVAFNYRII